MSATRFLASACAALAFTVSALGATVTVTSPSGLSASNGTPAYNTWYADDNRSGGQVGITNQYADAGNGSLQFVLPSDTTAKADVAYYFSNTFSLTSLTAFSYDFYRSSSSGNQAYQDPALRLYVSDGAGHSGSLVYEAVYNGYPTTSPAPSDQFITADAYNSGNAQFWGTSSLGSSPGTFTRSISDWEAQFPNLKVLGITTGAGSGWSGSFNGAVDNITFGVNGSNTTFNFETSSTAPTPEPGSLVLLGTGLVGVGGELLRRRRALKANV